MVILSYALLERAEMEVRSHAPPDLTLELRKALEAADKQMIAYSESFALTSQ
ncbi:hypothetical protein PSCICO_31890 [Pseudomonas cichorii]|uniref:hypothetical protein n=1 Tax=Pseudomonas cichorii TaxID=36746 RepID=UPI0019108ED8|nr:hypothetical protein [Pseudomonas cichorii]GFM87790.1 hypothetical protein PSCICO_31890 [Pseudomonas cichorii]